MLSACATKSGSAGAVPTLSVSAAKNPLMATHVILSGMLRTAAAICVLSNAIFAQPCTSGNFAGVLTHHNNNYRTGANLDETCLTPSAVSSPNFGKLFTLHV